MDDECSFPHAEASTVLLVFVDSIGKDEFARILGEHAPGWIIDVRAVPRLDTIAVSRLSAFSLFERASASYVDLFGRLGIKSYRVAESNPAYWRNAVFDLLNGSDREGPYLFLFDDEPLFFILPGVIELVLGKAPRVAHIPP
jgi:hypothetical protein